MPDTVLVLALLLVSAETVRRRAGDWRVIATRAPGSRSMSDFLPVLVLLLLILVVLVIGLRA